MNHDITSCFSVSQAVSDTTTVASRPSLLTGSQSMCNTNLTTSNPGEPEFQHNTFPTLSFSWSIGETNSRENVR